MVVIATLKQENGGLSAYIRKGGKVEKFNPGTAYYGEWDIGTLTEAVFIVYPLALFVSSDKFDRWDEEVLCYACNKVCSRQEAEEIESGVWWCGCED